MCDHCSQMTSHKDYAGQVTCVCGDGNHKIDKKKKNTKKKEDEYYGCCDIQGSTATTSTKHGDSCCGAKNCRGTKETDSCCKNKQSSSITSNRKTNGNSNNGR